MIVEYAQLMSTAHRILDGYETVGLSKSGRKKKVWTIDSNSDSILYAASHINHPSAVWTRQSVSHYKWLYSMWSELLSEYTFRYGKTHATSRLMDYLKTPPKNMTDNGFVEPPPAMPDYCKVAGDAIASYRTYYIKEKSRFAKWKVRETPQWFIEGMQNANI